MLLTVKKKKEAKKARSSGGGRDFVGESRPVANTPSQASSTPAAAERVVADKAIEGDWEDFHQGLGGGWEDFQ